MKLTPTQAAALALFHNSRRVQQDKVPLQTRRALAGWGLLTTDGVELTLTPKGRRTAGELLDELQKRA